MSFPAPYCSVKCYTLCITILSVQHCLRLKVKRTQPATVATALTSLLQPVNVNPLCIPAPGTVSQTKSKTKHSTLLNCLHTSTRQFLSFPHTQPPCTAPPDFSPTTHTASTQYQTPLPTTPPQPLLPIRHNPTFSRGLPN